MIGLEGGELHHTGSHWRSLLICRKDRVSNRMYALYESCGLRLQSVISPIAAIPRIAPVIPGHPLYRPGENLAMVRGGLAS
jgi:hypothetical protein